MNCGDQIKYPSNLALSRRFLSVFKLQNVVIKKNFKNMKSLVVIHISKLSVLESIRSEREQMSRNAKGIAVVHISNFQKGKTQNQDIARTCAKSHYTSLLRMLHVTRRDRRRIRK